MGKNDNENIIASNPKARHDYFIDDTIECGIELVGTEVKSVRLGKVNMKDSYALIKNGELFVLGMHISPYEQGNIFNKDPLRPRKLLLHKLEIIKLIGQTKQKGYSLIPINLYFSGNFLKITLGVGKGKKLYDKREDIAKRDAEMRVKKEFGKNI